MAERNDGGRSATPQQAPGKDADAEKPAADKVAHGPLREDVNRGGYGVDYQRSDYDASLDEQGEGPQSR